MLIQYCPPEKLCSILLPQEQWHPFPTASEREPWQALSKSIRQAYTLLAEGYLEYRWPELQAVRFLMTQPRSSLGHIDERQLVNTGIDLIPTLCGLARIDYPAHLDGHDWSEVLSNSDLPLQRDHVVVETEFGTFGQPCGYLGRAVRTPRYKYMVYNAGENREFLVDMEDDPGETINLAGNPDHEKELDRHRALLRDYIARTDDIFPIDMVSANVKSPAEERIAT